MPPKLRRQAGFTLLETIVALALWMILVAGATQYLSYVGRTSWHLVMRQDAFENARATLDALTANLQMADTIKLKTDSTGMLKELILTERDPDGNSAEYNFYYKADALPSEAKYRRLEFGLNDEFASRLCEVRLIYHPTGQMEIIVATDEESGPAIRLTGTVDVRYKAVTVNGV